MDIRSWLAACGLGAHAEAFEREELTVADLAEVTDEELRGLGLSLGARKALRRALGAGSSAVAGTPVPGAGDSFLAGPTQAGPMVGGGAVPGSIDGYPVAGVLGQGGMGSVYRVRDRHTDRPLALKTLRLDLIDSDGLRQRFTREYGLLQHLNHPQVVRVFSMGEDQQSGLYYTMELLEGGSLESRVRVHAPDGEQALSWWRQIAAGVAAAHDAGVWHRDLKPANVVFRDPEAPVVVDWGLGGGVTANSRTGALGTAVWAAPEQAAGVTGAFTDVYGLSALLLWLLTEELPTNEEAAIGRYLRDVGGDERLAPVLARGLAGKRRRYGEVGELMKAVDECVVNQEAQERACEKPGLDEVGRRTSSVPVPLAEIDMAVQGNSAAGVTMGERTLGQNESVASPGCLDDPSKATGKRPSEPKPERVEKGSEQIRPLSYGPLMWPISKGEDEFGHWAALFFEGAVQRFRWCPPGTFMMGSARKTAFGGDGEVGRSADERLHEVRITKGFWLGETPCTQAMWQAVTKNRPSRFSGKVNRPVEQVDWQDCQDFLTQLNRCVDGLCARLPTEAEWEYACRAGATTAFNDGGSSEDLATTLAGLGWFSATSNGQTHDVGKLRPNAWGLFDMHGNISEWCADWYGKYPKKAIADPRGPAKGRFRVHRGGSWNNSPEHCRCASRARAAPAYRSSGRGLRLLIPTESMA